LKEKHLLTSEQEDEVEHCINSCSLDKVWVLFLCDVFCSQSRRLNCTKALIWEMYGCKLAVYSPKQIPLSEPLDPDLETARAENLYYSSRTAEALKVCKVPFCLFV
jgi:hypothetical protein